MNLKAYSSLDVIYDPEAQKFTFPDYPFPSKKTRIVSIHDFDKIVDWSPPALQLKSGEYIFIKREQLDTLKNIFIENHISIVRQQDLWSHILDPFLDTQFDKAHYQHTDKILRDAGLTQQDVKRLRSYVRGSMTALTAISWEWVHYGLFDVLMAKQPLLPFGQKRWIRFYWDAMEIALRGGLLSH